MGHENTGKNARVNASIFYIYILTSCLNYKQSKANLLNAFFVMNSNPKDADFQYSPLTRTKLSKKICFPLGFYHIFL